MDFIVYNALFGRDIDVKRTRKSINAPKIQRQHVVNNHTPSSAKPGDVVSFEMPKLGEHDMIVPGSFYISFKLDVKSDKDKKRTIVPNIGRKIVKKMVISFEGKEIVSVDDYDELFTYFDFFLPKKEKTRRIPQGIDTDAGLALRVEAEGATGTTEEKAVGKTFGKTFRIPIDFEMLSDISPFSQHSLKDKLQIDITFNSPEAVILAGTGADLTKGVDYAYSIKDLRMEYDIINEPSMSLDVKRQYDFGVIVPFKRYIKYRFEEIDKSDSVINLKINAPCKSLSHVLIFAIDPNDRKDWSRKEIFKNLDIKSVNVAIEGKPNQLYASGLTTQYTYDQVLKFFNHNTTVTIGEFLTTKYALVLDLRGSYDDGLHGNGLELKDEMTVEIKRIASGSGKLRLYVFLVQDAQIGIQESRFTGDSY